MFVGAGVDFISVYQVLDLKKLSEEMYIFKYLTYFLPKWMNVPLNHCVLFRIQRS